MSHEHFSTTHESGNSGGELTQELEQLARERTFHEHFPSGVLKAVQSLAEMPEEAVRQFENQSQGSMPRLEYRPGSFTGLYAVTHDDGSMTYLARQTVTPKHNGQTEEDFYLYETDGQNKMGYGRIARALTPDGPHYQTGPFVGYTYTEEDMRGQGLGTRRLEVMNAVSQAFYHKPIHSSETNEGGRSLWERLEREGRARKLESDERRWVYTG